jgi:hypothetical protein
MKKIAIIFILPIALLAQPSHAKDSCKTLLCMAGMFQGVGVVDNCEGAVRDYFSIVRFDHHHRFKPGATKRDRGNFLGGCGFDPEGWGPKINNQYGTVRGFGF